MFVDNLGQDHRPGCELTNGLRTLDILTNAVRRSYEMVWRSYEMVQKSFVRRSLAFVRVTVTKPLSVRRQSWTRSSTRLRTYERSTNGLRTLVSYGLLIKKILRNCLKIVRTAFVAVLNDILYVTEPLLNDH